MIRRSVLATAVAALTCVALPANAARDDSEQLAKLGPALKAMHGRALEAAAGSGARRGARTTDLPVGKLRAGDKILTLGTTTPDGYAVINAVASGSASELAVAMRSLGARNVVASGRVVSAQVPADQLAALAARPELAFARPVLAATDVGTVTSQGDRSMRTNLVRAKYGFDGTGMTIGVLSDSFACDPGPLNGSGVYTTPAEDVANGDLPNVQVLKDLVYDGCIDEGRGMAQLIHDVIPGARIAFYTAFDGQADFANGIRALAQAGADVIVDDVIYFDEPMFQDGIIAQAADEVARLGVPYYSSNGNRARDAYQSIYRPVSLDGATFHDFDPGPGVDPRMTVTLNGELQTNLTFQWDSPNFSVSGAPGARNDVDVVMFDAAGQRVPDCFPGGVFEFPAAGLCQFVFTDGGVPIDGGNGGDAIELVSLVDFVGGSTVQIGFETQSGRPPGFVKFVIFGGGFESSEYAIDAPSAFGHNNAAGAEGVGAAAFYFTEEFIGEPRTLPLREQAGEPPCRPACLNDFSSAGGTPILFDTDGRRLRFADVRLKPGITGPDGTNTSFFLSDTSRDDDDGDGVFQSDEAGEFPNFFGTSAAAPHVAAVAVMMLDAENSQIRTQFGGTTVFRMCQARDGDRDRGRTRFVSPGDVSARIADGWLLGPCDRTEPRKIYRIKRQTAQDMKIRASNSTGETLQVFRERVVPGAKGFDFDSGYGFIDAAAALKKFLDRDDD